MIPLQRKDVQLKLASDQGTRMFGSASVPHFQPKGREVSG